MFMIVKKRSWTSLWNAENHPANDITRDMYGRPLKPLVLKTAPVEKNTWRKR
jgi:hypothetical protein